ncbi:MAG: ABC transporter substrate-binding protein [Vulcanimicrobiaceae bacterium]
MHARSVVMVGLVCLFGASAAFAAGGPMTGKAVKVGVIADVTGSAGAYGTAQKNAFDLASDDLKAGLIDAAGATITFDVEDAASDPAQVVNLTQKFTSDGSALLIGPTLSSEAKKADPIAVKANLPILAISNTAQGITAMGPCVYRDALAEEQVVPEAVARAKKTWNVKTAAIIYGDDDQFTKTDYLIFKDALDKAGINVVDTETFHKGDVDFKAQLTKIAGAKPDMLVVGALVQEAVKIIQQANAQGLKTHVIGGNGLNSPQLFKLAGKDAEGVVVGAAYYAGNDYPGNKAFVDRYQKKFGIAPDQFAAQAYAAAQIVAHAVKEGATSGDQMCAALKTSGVPTVLGPVSFETTRDAHAPSAILQVKGDRFAEFK